MKNYDWAIGKKFGELTILSYTMPIKEHKYQRDCVCLCSCGEEIVTRLNRVLRGDTNSCGHLRSEMGKKYSSRLDQTKAYEARTSVDKPLSTSTTGIRNISKSDNESTYRVYISRHGKTYRKRAKTLEEAKLIKKELIKKAEKEFGEVIYKKHGKI